MSHHDANGVFSYASPRSVEVLGLKSETLLGLSLLDIPFEPDRERVRASWNTLPQNGLSQRIRFRVLIQDKLHAVETHVRRIVDGPGAGTIVCLSRIADDLIHAELGWTHWKELVTQIPGIVWYAPLRPDGTRQPAEFISDYLERVVGYTPQQWLTDPNFWPSIIHPDDLQRTLEATARCIADGTPVPPYRVLARSGKIIYFQSYMRVYRNPAGIPERLYGLTLDVTQFKEVEVAKATLLQELIALSAPVIPVDEQIIVVPLMSVLDAARAARLMASLLEGVARRNVQWAIVDLTGISSVNAAGAAGLVQAARAAQLLGARVMLSGMSADVARWLVGLGLSLEGLPTRATLLRALEEIRLRKD